MNTRFKLFALSFCLALVAFAQQPTGSITGTVSDPTGAAVVGAKVVATNLNTGLTRDTTTANDGGYVFPLLPVGFYSVSVQAQGFRGFEQRGFTIHKNRPKEQST